MQIWLRRAYDRPGGKDGFRVLVDRLWPRGVSKEALKLDAWLKEIAPSSALRRWFDHDPRKWSDFKRRYRAELNDSFEGQKALETLKSRAQKGRLTLVYASREKTYNNAVALKEILKNRIAEKNDME
jgi:uncharacterized protein YeaO (DUF488 family)